MSDDRASLMPALRAHPFLRGLSEAHLKMIADCAEHRTFSRHAYLMRQYRPAQCFFLLLSGRVSLCTHVAPRGVVQVDMAEAPVALGWSWLAPPYRWHFDAQTLEPVETIIVHAPRIREYMVEHKAFANELYRRFFELVVSRVHGVQLQMMDIYAKPDSDDMPYRGDGR